MVLATGRLDNGVIVNHTVNWLSPMKERVTVVTGERAAAKALRQAIWDALGALSPENRSAVVLHYFLGFQQAEIAERTGAPVGTVRRRLHDARRRLRVLLAGVRS